MYVCMYVCMSNRVTYAYPYTYIYGYRRRKWTRRHELKTWPRLIAFHIALVLCEMQSASARGLVPLGKV